MTPGRYSPLEILRSLLLAVCVLVVCAAVAVLAIGPSAAYAASVAKSRTSPAPPSVRAAGYPERVRASIYAAQGAVIVVGQLTMGPARTARIALQQREHGDWVRRITGLTHRRGYFQLRALDARPPASSVFRVVVLRGARVVSWTGPLRPSARKELASSRLRVGALEVAPGALGVVSGSPSSGDAVLRLTTAGRNPRVGQVLVENSSGSRAGMIVVVQRTKRLHPGLVELWTSRGSLSEAFSSFDADVSGTLSSAPGSSPSDRADDHADEDGGSGTIEDELPTTERLTCTSAGSDTTFSPTAHVSFAGVRFTAIIDKSDAYASISLAGQPKINLDATFTTSATCTFDDSVPIAIPDTPLTLSIGPYFTLQPTGTITADWTWDPSFSFFYSWGLFTGASHQFSFSSHGRLSVFGNAQITADFDILDKLEADDPDLSVQALIGPEVNADANVSPQRQLCVSATDYWKADMSASAFGHDLQLGTLAWGFDNLIPRTCTAGSSTGPTGPTGGSGGGGTEPGGGAGGGSGGMTGSVPAFASVTPLGPTTGPVGLEVAVGTPACPEELQVSANGGQVEALTSSTPITFAMIGLGAAADIPTGTYHFTFVCADHDGSSVLWRDPGFTETLTAPLQIEASNSTASAGGAFEVLSGLTDGPAPCPTLGGVPPSGLALQLAVGSAETDVTAPLPDSASNISLSVPTNSGSGADFIGEECSYPPVLAGDPGISASQGVMGDLIDYLPLGVTVK